jgi:hypothetical protein
MWAALPVPAYNASGYLDQRNNGDKGNIGRQIGVRVWNNGTAPVRLGYDTGTLPATLVLPEK